LKKPHPLLQRLADGKRNKDKGWLRRELAATANLPEPQPRSPLKTPEKILLTIINTATNSINSAMHPTGSNPTSDHAHAWRMSKQSIYNGSKSENNSKGNGLVT